MAESCTAVVAEYYDGDYPPWTTELASDPEASATSLAWDVPHYLALAHRSGGRVLDVCTATGRIAIPLAREGFEVTAVDVSAAMLDRLRDKLRHESDATRQRVRIVQDDIVHWSIDESYGLALLGLNTLLSIEGRERQAKALRSITAHLAESGRVVVDVLRRATVLARVGRPTHVGPLRRHPLRDVWYQRHVDVVKARDEGAVELTGWYEEMSSAARPTFDLGWTLVDDERLQEMLADCGCVLESKHGGHRGEPIAPTSKTLVVVGRKAAEVRQSSRRRLVEPIS